MQEKISRAIASLFLALIGFCSAGAQTNNSSLQTFYYNQVWELTTPEKSFYRREAYFDLANIFFDGVYRDYDKSNRLIGDGSYYQGERSGIHTTYAEDFSVKSKIEYNGNDFTIWELPDADKNLGVKNGNGKFTIPYYYLFEKDGRTMWKSGVLEGEFMNGKKTGYWLYFDNANQPTATDIETYKNGKFLQRKHFAIGDTVGSKESKEQKLIYLSLPLLTAESLIQDAGSFSQLNQYFEKYITYPDYFHRKVGFPGGFKRLLFLLAQLSNVPESYMEVLQVRINEHGITEDIEVARSVNGAIDDFAQRAFTIYENRLLPAMKDGKAVKSDIYIPISGGARWASALTEFPTEWFYDARNFLD